MNSSYGFISINILALAMIALALFVLWGKKDKNAAKELMMVFTFIFIGSLFIFLEGINNTIEYKLLYRNLSQFGLFLLPAASYNFVMAYTNEENSFFKRMRIVNFIFAIICVLLILTNDLHHIMRVSVALKEIPSGFVLRVNQTIFGKIAVAINTLMNLTAMVKLWIYMRTTSSATKTQVKILLVGFLIPIIYTYTKSSILNFTGIEIPTPLSFLVGVIFLLIGMYKYDFMSISPIARDWVLDEINIGMIFTNESGEIVDTNVYVKDNFSKSHIETAQIISNYTEWQEAITDKKNHLLDIEYTNKNGETVYYKIRVHNLTKKSKQLGSVSLISDISKEKKHQLELIQLAEKDSMTQVLNRTTFESRINELLENKDNDSDHFGLMIIDIDEFKSINDTFGHQAGDHVLKEVVNIIRNHFRNNDLVGRLGGDEFIGYIDNCNEDDVEKIANRIKTSISDYDFKYNNQNIKVTLSIGMTLNSKETTRFEDLYRQADSALYKVKENGRNGYSLYSETAR